MGGAAVFAGGHPTRFPLNAPKVRRSPQHDPGGVRQCLASSRAGCRSTGTGRGYPPRYLADFAAGSAVRRSRAARLGSAANSARLCASRRMASIKSSAVTISGADRVPRLLRRAADGRRRSCWASLVAGPMLVSRSDRALESSASNVPRTSVALRSASAFSCSK